MLCVFACQPGSRWTTPTTMCRCVRIGGADETSVENRWQDWPLFVSPCFCGRRARVRREEYRTDFVLTRVDGAPPLLDLPSYSTTPPLYSTQRKRLRAPAARRQGSCAARWVPTERDGQLGGTAHDPSLGGREWWLGDGTRCADADALGLGPWVSLALPGLVGSVPQPAGLPCHLPDQMVGSMFLFVSGRYGGRGAHEGSRVGFAGSLSGPKLLSMGSNSGLASAYIEFYPSFACLLKLMLRRSSVREKCAIVNSRGV
jgi:hypothetical protein